MRYTAVNAMLISHDCGRARRRCYVINALFGMETYDWFRGKNRVTNKVKITKFGAVFLCFSAESCIADAKQHGGWCFETKSDVIDRFSMSYAQK